MSFKVVNVVKSLIITYIITVIMLLMLSLYMFKAGLDNSVVDMGIYAVYGLSTFVGGGLLARKQRNRGIIWGSLIGIVYYIVLLMASLLISKGAFDVPQEMIKGFIICVLGGGLGGIFVMNVFPHSGS